jgi:hypothetical protein
MAFLRISFIALLGLLMLLVGIWGTLVLSFSGTGTSITGARMVLAAGFALLSVTALVALCRPRWRWRAVAAYGLTVLILLVWWQGIEPSNNRDWQDDVAVLPFATFDGDQVRVHNIRNFAYRSETDYRPAYYDRVFQLSKLQGVDLLSVYWMGPAVAHVFLSFAFSDGQHLAVSIETRKEKGEGYSTLRGFFRQYELFYVVADERDVIRLRTNYRHAPPEDVYLYRLDVPIENARSLFLEYLRSMNALRQQPEFYNSLTTNCTTRIWMMAGVNSHRLPLSWKILASGYVPEYLFENGRLATDGQSFAELQRQALINPRAKAADSAEDFSRLIRTLPVAP